MWKSSEIGQKTLAQEFSKDKCDIFKWSEEVQNTKGIIYVVISVRIGRVSVWISIIYCWCWLFPLRRNYDAKTDDANHKPFAVTIKQTSGLSPDQSVTTKSTDNLIHEYYQEKAQIRCEHCHPRLLIFLAPKVPHTVVCISVFLSKWTYHFMGNLWSRKNQQPRVTMSTLNCRHRGLW